MPNNLNYLIPMSLSSFQLVSVDEAVRALHIGRTKFYELVADKYITPVKLGRRTLIKASDLQAFIESLPTAGGAQ